MKLRKHYWIIMLLLIAAAYGGLRLTGRWMAQGTGVAAPGEPTTAEELNAWYPAVPENQNAATLYLKAFEEKVWRQDLEAALPFYEASLPSPGEPLPKSMHAALETYLEVEAEEIQLLHDAAALSKCRYPVDFRSDEPVSFMSKLRHSVDDLSIEAIFETEQQHSDAAIQSLQAGLAAAGSLRDYPTFIAPLVRMACFKKAFQVLERMLSQSALTETQLLSLSSAIGMADTFEGVSRGLVGMRCSLVRWFEHPSTYLDEIRNEQDQLAPPWIAAGYLSWGFYRWSGLADFEHGRFNAMVREWQEARRKGFPDNLLAAQELQIKVNALPEWKARITRAFLSRGSIANLMSAEAEQRARVSVVQTALAIERFRLANNVLPERLEDMVPVYLTEVLPDPFDGKALRYKRQPVGYVVYSIGMNLQDDGGSKPAQYNHDGDIVFEAAGSPS